MKRGAIHIRPLDTIIPVLFSQSKKSVVCITLESLKDLEQGKYKIQCDLKLLCRSGPWESNNFLVTELSTTKGRVLQIA